MASPYLIDETNTCTGQNNTTNDFLSHCYYHQGDGYNDYKGMIEVLRQCHPLYNVLVYLAIPPHIFSAATHALRFTFNSMNAIPGFVRVILEKPFGKDTKSCQSLLRALKQQHWNESDLYRIDHYLGKIVIRNIVQLHQHNFQFCSLRDSRMIESVHVILKEPFGVEGRGGFYDAYGVIRDVIQNHLLQILTLIAMELPSTASEWTADSIRDAKVRVLKCIPIIPTKDCLLGQYDSYAQDTTIKNKTTTTPTYACIRLSVNCDTWRGIPFIIEAGKSLNEGLCEVRFKLKDDTTVILRIQPSPSIYCTSSSKLAIGIYRERRCPNIRIDEDVDSGGSNETVIMGAYATLVLDALRGRSTNFVRDDELLEAWRIFTSLLHDIEEKGIVPIQYQQGTYGPTGRNEFVLNMLKCESIFRSSL
jgi:glucose-6-phosphate 1-dehydrogenase